MLFAAPVSACWVEAGQRYDISPGLLYAVAITENMHLNPHAVSPRNKDGSFDISLMQINTGWLPALAKFGITLSNLWDACTSINVGAWILAGNIAKYGMTWNAVGAYNAGCKNLNKTDCDRLRYAYAWKVYRNYQSIYGSGRQM